MKKYRVIYHIGDKVDIKTKVESGFVILDNSEIKLINKTGDCIANLVDISKISLHILNGLGSMLRITVGDRTFYISVVRFCIAGQFAVINAMGTRKLRALLETYNLAV